MADRTRYTGNLVSNTNLFSDPTTDRIGIGTTNPTSKLHVVGNVNVSGMLSSSNINTGIITATEYYGTFKGTLDTTVSSTASVAYASTSGISTVSQGLTGTPNLNVGIVTATSFVGNLTGTATTATNLSNAANITTGTINSARLSGNYDISVSYASTSGISTVSQGLTGTPSISITNLNASGISTLGTVEISSGIITATSGVVTYFGDGSRLSGISTSINLSNNTANQNQLLTYGVSTGSTTGLGVTNTLVYNPSGSRLGIGTTNPLVNLHLINDLLVSSGSTFGVTRDIQIKAYSNELGALSFEDVDNSGSIKQYFSITKDTTSTLFAVNDDNYNTRFIVGADGSVGIGTTNPTSRLHVVGGDIRVGVNTSQGVILTSPSGFLYRLVVNDSGVLSTVATGGDPDLFFSSVSLLLPGDGANGSTSIIDRSPSPKTITVVGNAQISTAQSVFGGASMLFDGNGDYLGVPTSADFAFSGDFTLEAWIRAQALAPVNLEVGYVFDFRDSSTTNGFIFALRNVSSAGRLYYGRIGGGVNEVQGTTNVPLNTWHHIALVRNGSNVRAYLNGVSDINTTDTYSQPSTMLTIGARFTRVAEFFNGYIDDLRITKGVARYTSNFTPPTLPHPTF